MIFSLIILVLVGAIAFFHHSQGLFSSFLSAVIAAISAAVALGFHDQIVLGVSGGKIADSAHAGVLCALFGLTYMVLRVVFDALVPGNVNFGVWPDRIGGGVMGLIAGLFTGGIVAIAAQALPFGPSIGGFARLETVDHPSNLSAVPDWARYGRNEDVTAKLINYDQLKGGVLDVRRTSGLLLPADSFALGFIGSVSAGSLAGDTKWSEINPDYLNQLFAQRLGLQPGAKHTAFPVNGQDQLEVAGVYRLDASGVSQIDGDLQEFRPTSAEPIFQSTLTPGEGQSLIIVRAILKNDASETDNKVRLSLSSFRLVSGGKNFYPVAVMNGTDLAVFQRADDFLIVDGGRGVDLVFSVDTEALVGKDADAAAADAKLAAGMFIEFKRLSRVKVGGSELKAAGDFETDPRTEGSILRRKGWPAAAK